MNVVRSMPDGFDLGPLQGRSIIGEVTESLHKFLIDGWPGPGSAPRIEEDLSFVPKDREEVVYVYMYRVAHNSALNNSKRWRATRFQINHDDGSSETFLERPPIYLELHYLIAVHSKFRSDAERLLGWVLLRLHEATHLVYRPRRFTLPDRREVDSVGNPYRLEAEGDEVIMEKVSLSMIDDLTVGDVINFFTIHEAPYRPFVTYKARCAMEGSLLSAPATTVRHERVSDSPPMAGPPSGSRANGRLTRPAERPKTKPTPGPEAHDIRPIEDDN